jgi:hypothetical protein
MVPINEVPCGNPPLSGLDTSGYTVFRCPPDCALRAICEEKARELGITASGLEQDISSPDPKRRLPGRYAEYKLARKVGEQVVSDTGIPYPRAQGVIDHNCKRTNP